MRIGVKLAPIYVGYPALELAWTTAAESAAFDSIWTYDHFYPREEPGPCFEGWTTLAVLAHHAPTQMIGHLVLAAPYRHPSLLAKMATVMDHATKGRFVLGLGAGHRLKEATDFRLPMASPIGRRMAELESTLRWVRHLWQAAPPGGEHDRVTKSSDADLPIPTDAVFAPPNHTPGGPPIWIGTSGESVGLRLVARYADGWNYSGIDVDAFARKLELLHGYCAEIGRDPADISVSVQFPLRGDEDERRATVERGVHFRASGCDHLVLMAETARGPVAVDEAATVATAVREA